MLAHRYRWIVALLLFAAGSINYMDRPATGVVAAYIQKSFAMTTSQLGLSFSTFFVGYALFAFAGGQLADRFGPVPTSCSPARSPPSRRWPSPGRRCSW